MLKRRDCRPVRHRTAGHRPRCRGACTLLASSACRLGAAVAPALPRRHTPSPCMATLLCPTSFRACLTSMPDAPKGGRMVQGVLGTFDSLNPFIVKGLAGAGASAATSFESLMARGYDEPFTLYGLLAAHGRDRRRAQLRHLRARSGGALFRRRAGDGRRRGLFLAAAARSRPAQSPRLLFQGRQGRDARRAHACVSISAAATTANCRSSSA